MVRAGRELALPAGPSDGPTASWRLPSRLHFRYTFIMTKSISVHQKRGRGRPATGRDPLVSARVPADVIAKIEEWAAKNGCTRSIAIAALLAKALGIDKPIAKKVKPIRDPKPIKSTEVVSKKQRT